MPDIGGIAGERLRSFVERIERLHEERRSLAADISEVFAEAKGTGFDVKVMRIVIARRAMDSDDLAEQDTIVELYEAALGTRPAPTAEPPAPRHEEARAQGYADGLAGDARDNAGLWPAGEYGHADYEMGFEDGRKERIDRLDREEADRMPPAASRARARARQRIDA